VLPTLHKKLGIDTKRRSIIAPVVSKRIIGRVRHDRDTAVPFITTAGTFARNELDSHADTSCAGANWSLLQHTGQLCEVNPFLSSYDPVREIPVARCGTVWTCDVTGRDYLLVGDEMLWFGTQLQHSLINPNQVRSSGLKVHDNPFATSAPFGIEFAGNGVFIPFNTTGTIVHFESRVPNDWEKVHLPVLPLFPDRWDPNDALMLKRTRNREENENYQVFDIWLVTAHYHGYQTE
jgi:hypothetical protein